MQYHCRSCEKEIRVQSGSYSYVLSQIVLHLDRCDVTGRFSAEQRLAEASRAADEKFFVSRTSRADKRHEDEARGSHWR